MLFSTLRHCMLVLYPVVYTVHCLKSDFHSCENENVTVYPKSVNIVSAGFPRTSASAGCVCVATSAGDLEVFLRVLVVNQHSEDLGFPLSLNYTRTVNGTMFIVDSLEKFQASVFEDDLKIAENTSNVTIGLKQTRENETSVNFVFKIAAVDISPSDKIVVKCKSERSNDTKDSDENSKDGEVLDYIQGLCSAPMVILLCSLSVALLIIILVVSIILCCVMPRKQRKQIAKIRQTMLLENDTTPYASRADRIRPDTVIYDDPGGNRPNTIFSLDTSGHQYANTNVQKSQLDLYQNSEFS